MKRGASMKKIPTDYTKSKGSQHTHSLNDSKSMSQVVRASDHFK